ncbi:MAG: DUF1844 domain-containing protein, partial [Pirellulales bacterium]
MSTENSEEPKLIIDEDWKSQVQREKELLKQGKNSAEIETKSAQSAQSDEPSDVSTNDESDDDGQLTQEDQNEAQAPPPATFEFLISGMATQAFAAMGLLPGDDGKPMPTRLDYARHYIDLLSILETKTAGNLSDSEQSLLKSTLHQLRMMF